MEKRPHRISWPALLYLFVAFFIHLAETDAGNDQLTISEASEQVEELTSIATYKFPLVHKIRGRVEKDSKPFGGLFGRSGEGPSAQVVKSDLRGRLEDTPELELLVESRLHELNEVLARKELTALLRFFSWDVRVDAPGRAGVHGHGAELVFALESLVYAAAGRSVLIEDMIQLQLIHLKDQNDPPKQWFLLTRNSLPLNDESGVQEGGKAVMLWQFVRDSAQANESQKSETDDIKGQLMIRWLIWNSNGDEGFWTPCEGPSIGARQDTPQGEGASGSNSKSVKLLYASLHNRWRYFNRALMHNDSRGCLDFISPDTVIMPPGNPAVRGPELKLVCDAFVGAGVTQHVTIHEALLFKGKRLGPRGEDSAYTKIKYFVLENDAFTNTYTESNTTETGKQVIFWELLKVKENSKLEDFPLRKGSLKWGWTIWNSNEPEVKVPRFQS